MFDTFSGVTDDYLLKQGKALISNHKNYVFSSGMLPSTTSAPKRTVLCFDAQRSPCFKVNFSDDLPLFYSGNSRNHCIYHFLQGTLPLMVKPIENTILSEKKFISNASHELKTPLSVISANAELLSSEVGRDNKHLLYIQQETSRMISLVQKMLTLTRLDAPQIQNTHAVFPVDDALLDIIYPMESVAFENTLRFPLMFRNK